MQSTAKTYQKAAIVLWGAVCGAAGWSFGFSRDWEGRKLIFAVIVSVGVYGLVLLQWSRRQGNNKKDSSGEMIEANKTEHSYEAKDSSKTNIFSRDLATGQNTNSNNKEGTRQKLDEFLLIQQYKK